MSFCIIMSGGGWRSVKVLAHLCTGIGITVVTKNIVRKGFFIKFIWLLTSERPIKIMEIRCLRLIIIIVRAHQIFIVKVNWNVGCLILKSDSGFLNKVWTYTVRLIKHVYLMSWLSDPSIEHLISTCRWCVKLPFNIVHHEEICLSYLSNYDSFVVQLYSLHGLLLQFTRLNLG